MSIFDLVIRNFFTAPLISFFLGGLLSLCKTRIFLPQRMGKFLTFAILFLIGFKGGGPLVEHFDRKAIFILTVLIGWGFLLPFIAYGFLRISTKLDKLTASALSASFGSISVMTFVAGTSFLESLNVGFEKLVIGMLAIMEIPGIISGLLLAKASGNLSSDSLSRWQLVREALLNKTVFAIFGGLILGSASSYFQLGGFIDPIILSFKFLLCLFLFDMGQRIAKEVRHAKTLSWPLSLFGFYMPLIGAATGLAVSYLFKLDSGTGTLIALLTASASYIAVPAAMRIALPKARESVYLPLALGITFPFNVLVGIPVYYKIAVELLG